MPKNPLAKFTRRRSSGNVLDVQSENPPPAQVSSFRVLERPEKTTFDGSSNYQKRLSEVRRPFNSPLQATRLGKSVDDLHFSNTWVDSNADGINTPALRRVRGSGGTTNSGSSGYYDSSVASARHSSSSTLPSSLDAEGGAEEEDHFPRKVKTAPIYQTVAISELEPPPPPPPSFKARAERAFSFGLKGGQRRTDSYTNTRPTPVPTSPVNDVPSRPASGHSAQSRDRAMTSSSYASTTVPSTVVAPRLDADPGLGANNSFGDDFGNMFNGVERKSNASSEDGLPLPPPPTMRGFHRSDSEPIFPPRTHPRQTLTSSPAHGKGREQTGSPHSWDGRNSHDGLMSSPAMNSPVSEGFPPVPRHGGIAPAFLRGSKKGYELVPERHASPGPERQSVSSNAEFMEEHGAERSGGRYDAPQANRLARLNSNSWDEKRRDLRDSQETRLSEFSSKSSFQAPSYSSAEFPKRPQPTESVEKHTISPGASEEGSSLFGKESINTTPRPAKLQPRRAEGESLFDVSPSGPASRAIISGSQHAHPTSETPRKLTNAQFEHMQRQRDVSGADSGSYKSEEDEEILDDYDDDDVEHAKQATRQRRKQEANMAVYRQQMKKVAGGGPRELPNSSRPELNRTSVSAAMLGNSFGGLHLGGVDGRPPQGVQYGKHSDEEDEDVPLGILQAHGFPGKNRPSAARVGDAPMSPRALSVAGTMAGGNAGQGNLPPFARRLPQDPYFGSSLVNPSNRESLAFSVAGSAYGGVPEPRQMGHPGGLVGVIAGEERARAARRGSPNAQGGYGPITLPSNMIQQQMLRTMSMDSMASPMGGMIPNMGMGMPQMTPGMMTPHDQTQAQMAQLMQMQSQMMQQMLALQQGQMPMQLQLPPSMQQVQQQQLQPPRQLGQQFGQRPISIASQAPSFQQQQQLNQGRAMTMMEPPTSWNQNQRPFSGFALSVNGLNVHNGPEPGYTPSIAPSERSNIGLSSRYRPVATGPDGSGSSQSMTSSLTLQALTSQQGGQYLNTPESQQQQKSTIRVVDKPKGAPKSSPRQAEADEDDDQGWAEMRRKREELRKRRVVKDNTAQVALEELYRSVELCD